MTTEIDDKIDCYQNYLDNCYKEVTKTQKEIARLKEKKDREVNAQYVMLSKLRNLGFYKPNISPDGKWLQADGVSVCKTNSIAYQMIKDLALSK